MTSAVGGPVERAIPALRARPEVEAVEVVEGPIDGLTARVLVVVSAREWTSPAWYRMLCAPLVDDPEALAITTVTSGEPVPLTTTGLADLIGRPGALAAYVAPATDTERMVARVVEDIVGAGPVSMSDHFLDVGGDSLGLLELLGALEEEFGVVLDAEAVLGCRDLRELAQSAADQSPGSDGG